MTVAIVQGHLPKSRELTQLQMVVSKGQDTQGSWSEQVCDAEEPEQQHPPFTQHLAPEKPQACHFARQ